MPTSSGARKPRPKKTFKLYELVDGVHLKYMMEYDGATGPVAHKKAVEDGHVAPETPVVSLSPRNLAVASYEVATPARPVLKLKSSGKVKTPRAPKPAAPVKPARAAASKPANKNTKASTKAAARKPARNTKAAAPASPPPPPPAPPTPAGSNPFAE
jgi:hypothetical protein